MLGDHTVACHVKGCEIRYCSELHSPRLSARLISCCDPIFNLNARPGIQHGLILADVCVAPMLVAVRACMQQHFVIVVTCQLKLNQNFVLICIQISPDSI